MTGRRSPRQRVEFGDWQTPVELAREIVSMLDDSGFRPASVVEPTCGRGAFLAAAAERWPEAPLRGFEINPEHVAAARQKLGGDARITITRADFFSTDWTEVLEPLPEPILVIGNPPWVTSSRLGALESGNSPHKQNFKGFSGLDAITGKANFDVSEWMLLRLLEALRGRDFTLCCLCKAIVARRVMERAARQRWPLASGILRDIDAPKHFGAAVDAGALTVAGRVSETAPHPVRWPRYPSLRSAQPSGVWGVVDGVVTPDVDGYLRTRQLEGCSAPAWRSGVKHDRSSVMEFEVSAGGARSRTGGQVDLEAEFLYPLMKGSDVVHHRWPPTRAMLVPQRTLGQDTGRIRDVAPKTWAYLEAHRQELEARRSSIYQDKPPFSVFGVGDYTFAPWKVAIAGLYKRLSFMVVPPHRQRPVVFDDTTYFLAFESEAEARAAHAALTSDLATDFFQSRIFWEDKRPITKGVLQSLDLSALLDERRLTDLEPAHILHRL